MVASPEELARLVGQRRLPNTSLSVYGKLPGQPAIPPSTDGVPDNLRQRAAVAKQQRTQLGLDRRDLSFFDQVKSAGAMVLGNKAVQGLLKPLDALQTGGRMVVSGVEHLARAMPDDIERTLMAAAGPQSALGSFARQLDNIDEDKSRADKRSVVDRWMGVGGYGYGQVAESTGSKWQDRAQGLAGDILYDPLTYIANGAGGAVGKAGRTSSAGRAAMLDFGDDAVRALVSTGQDDLVARAAKGASWLTNSERSLLGIDEAGLRFMGQNGVRIPGTGRLSNVLGKGTGTIRRGVVGSRPWQKISSDPQHLKEAMGVLQSGKATPNMSMLQAAGVIAFDEGRRMEDNFAKNVMSQAAQDVKVSGPDGVLRSLPEMDEASRIALTHSLENGGGKEMRSILDRVYKAAKDAGIDIAYRKDQVMHMWTKEGRDFMRGVEVVDAAGKKIKVDLTRESGASLQRIFGAGEHTINGKVVDFGKGTIDEINKAMTKAFPETGIVKWLEDDAVKLIAANIQGLAHDIGVVKGFQRLVESNPRLGAKLADVSDEVLDKVATKSANGELKKVLRKVLDDRAVERKALGKQSVKVAGELQKELTAAFGKQVDGLNARLSALGDAKKFAIDTGKSLDEQAKQLQANFREWSKVQLRKLQKLDARAKELDNLIEAANVEERILKGSAAKRLMQYAMERKQVEAQLEQLQGALAYRDALELSLVNNLELSAALRANAADPDAVRELAQTMVEQRKISQYVPSEDATGGIGFDYTEQIAKAEADYESFLGDMAKVAEEQADSAAKVVAAQAEQVATAKVAETKAWDNLVESAKRLNDRRVNRDGLMAVPTPASSEGATRLAQQQLDEATQALDEATTVREMLEKMSRSAEGDSRLADVEQVRPALLAAREKERAARKAVEQAKARLETAAKIRGGTYPTTPEVFFENYGVKGQFDRQDDIVAANVRVLKLTEARDDLIRQIDEVWATPKRTAFEEVAQGKLEGVALRATAPGGPVEAAAIAKSAAARAAKKADGEFADGFEKAGALVEADDLMEEALLAQEDAMRLLKELDEAERTVRRLERGAGRTAGDDATRAVHRKNAMKYVEELNKEIAKTEAERAKLVAKLPASERGYLTSLDNYNKARRLRVTAEETLQENEKVLTRAARRQTVEADAVAKADIVRALKDKQKMLAARRQARGSFVDVEVPAYQLAPLEQLRAELRSLPSSKPKRMPKGTAALIEESGVATPPSQVSDTMLSLLPEGEAASFRALRDQYNQMRTLVPDALAARAEKQVEIEQLQAQLNGLYAQGGAPEQVMAAATDLKAKLAKLHEEIKAIIPPKAARQAEFEELEFQLLTQVDFIVRYARAVEGGVKPSSDLATNTARKVSMAARDRYSKRLARARAAVAEGAKEEEVFSAFDEHVDQLMAVHDSARKKLQATRDYGRKYGKKLDEAERLDEIDRAARRRPSGFADEADESALDLTDAYHNQVTGFSDNAAAAREIGLPVEKLDAAVARGQSVEDIALARGVNPSRVGAALDEASPAGVAATRAELPAASEKFINNVLIRQSREAAAQEAALVEEELMRLFGIGWGPTDGKVKALLGLAEDANPRLVKARLRKFLTPQGTGKTYDAWYEEVRKPLIRELFNALDPKLRARFDDTLREQLRAMEKTANRFGSDAQRLGLNNAEVTTDWRRAIFGTGTDGALGARRAELNRDIGLYKKAQGQLNDAASVYDEAIVDQKVALANSDRPAMQAGVDATRKQLDGPTPSERIAGELSDVRTRRQSMVEERATELDRAMAEYTGMSDVVRKESQKIDAGRQAVASHKQLLGQTKSAIKGQVKQLKARAKSVKIDKKDVDKSLDEIDQIVKQLGDDPIFEPTLALHKAAVEQRLKLQQFDGDTEMYKTISDMAKLGADSPERAVLVQKTMLQIRDGWERVAKELLSEKDAVAVAEPIARAFKVLEDNFNDSEWFKALDNVTRFFKTYATMSPGFHVRNALSGWMMNSTEGVSPSTQMKATKMWRSYMHDPIKFIDSADEKTVKAFKAVFGSGAGGAFSAEELATEVGGRIMHNWATKLSKRAGTNVEGPLRLALAMHSISKGADEFGAVAAITRIHFDYSQLSRLDRRIKLFVPFWTFMSRNLPLQIQQQWRNPKVYSMWDHFVENMSAGNEYDGRPDWMANRDGVQLGLFPGSSMQTELMPDLPHLNAGAEFAPFLSGDPKTMLSAMNPMFTAPFEALANERFRFGSEIGGPGGRLAHMGLQMLPPLATAMRLTGQGRYGGQVPEKALNYLGVPLQFVSPEERQKVIDRQNGG